MGGVGWGGDGGSKADQGSLLLKEKRVISAAPKGQQHGGMRPIQKKMIEENLKNLKNLGNLKRYL